MSSLPNSLASEVARRRALLQSSSFPQAPQTTPENPKNTLRRLCQWARVLGPLAADRGITPDLTLQTTTYTPPPRTLLRRRAGSISKAPGKKGWKLYAVVDDPAGNSPPIARPERDLQARDRGILLTPTGRLILVKGIWHGGVGSLDVTPANVDFGDGMGARKTLDITPQHFPLPRALELLGGLAAIEGGLVHFAMAKKLDQ